MHEQDFKAVIAMPIHQNAGALLWHDQRPDGTASPRGRTPARSPDFFGARCNQIGPGLPVGLAPHAQMRIPRAVVALVEPIPRPRLSMGHENPGGPAEGPREMRGGVAHADDDVAGGHQGGQTVDVAAVVDIAKLLDMDTHLACDRRAFGAGVAML